MPILPHETLIVGSWTSKGQTVVADDNAKRVEELRRSELRELTKTHDGWEALFRDPSDGRLWELTYPHSEMHGGGPPTLRVVTREAAVAKYGKFYVAPA